MVKVCLFSSKQFCECDFAEVVKKKEEEKEAVVEENEMKRFVVMVVSEYSSAFLTAFVSLQCEFAGLEANLPYLCDRSQGHLPFPLPLLLYPSPFFDMSSCLAFSHILCKLIACW